VRARVSSLWVPRTGCGPSEYQDAYYPRVPGERRGQRLRFALADGATESLLSGRWADLLVRSYCRCPDRQLAGALYTARPIQWFEERGLAQGAHATFLGLQLTSARTGAKQGTWSAVAVGDTCLFHLRAGRLLASFPIDRPERFSSSPPLVTSRRNGHPQDRVEAARGDWRDGDTFVLATDALAHWFLGAALSRSHPARELGVAASGGPARFGAWVEELRSRREMTDDDVTVMTVDVL